MVFQTLYFFLNFNQQDNNPERAIEYICSHQMEEAKKAEDKKMTDIPVTKPAMYNLQCILIYFNIFSKR